MKLAELHTKVGEVVGVSEWILVDQALIDNFADCTGDHQFIHVDPERAAKSQFGGTIAHGLLTLGLLGGMSQTAVGHIERDVGVNYGFDKVRFLSPLHSGKRVRGTFKLVSCDEKRPREWLQKFEVTVEIEGEAKPALVAEWLMLGNE